MKRFITTFILVLSFGTITFAQKDAKAKELLDKSQTAFSNAGGISALFTMNVKDIKAKVTESFDGNILLKGNKFYFDSPEMETWFDGKTQWTYVKGSNEVNITEPDEKEAQMLNPAFIFSIYKKGCNYKYGGETTDNKNRTVQSVELLPNGKSDIKKIILQINKADFIPINFHIVYKNNIENIIYINKYQTRINHSDMLFVFDKAKYPKAELIDLR